MTHDETTQCLNLARAMDLIVSSRTLNGVFYVYNPAGQAKSWDSFVSEYPLERLQAMVERAQKRAESALGRSRSTSTGKPYSTRFPLLP